MFLENTYAEDIKAFQKISSTEADKLISDEDIAVFFVGRSTCPFCRKFAKKLSGLANKIDTIIYYVESDDVSDNEISSFREKYNIVTVPGFIVSKNGNVEVHCDSSLPREEILATVK